MSSDRNHIRQSYIAVIQAGGLGTRMYDYTHGLIPKPLLRLNGKPLLEWQMEELANGGITEFIIIIGHLGEKISEHFGDGRDRGYNIRYIRENEPLGSGGALWYVNKLIGNRDIILVYGDIMFDMDFDRAISFHETNQSAATLVVHPNSHPHDSDLIILDTMDRVVRIDKKGGLKKQWYKNCVNSGIYIIKKEVLAEIKAPQRLDLETDIISGLIKDGLVFGYRTPEYIKDVGTPERFETAEFEQSEGIWKKRSLKNKQVCVFLDRDGTVNKFAGLICDEGDLELEDNAMEAVKMINRSGMLVIVVTNQPVVARGLCSIEKLVTINNKMETLLGYEGAYLDDVIFCPHHPDKGYPEENPEYKIECDCRKPKTGMIEKAASRYNIDLSRSYMIGDTTQDIQTGINAGMHTILVRTGKAGHDRKYDVEAEFEADDLVDAVMYIESQQYTARDGE